MEWEGVRMKLCVRIVQNKRGDFVALCPSLPGCVSRGDTLEDARKGLDDAIRGYLAAVGNFVPENVLEEVVEA